MITAGGGFSMYSDTPSWQKDSVQAYLNKAEGNLPPESHYNRGGRGIPDVSAVAHNYAVYMGIGWEATDGTSASTPVVAGIMSMANARRVKDGKPKLGFVSPLLYKLSST